MGIELMGGVAFFAAIYVVSLLVYYDRISLQGRSVGIWVVVCFAAVVFIVGMVALFQNALATHEPFENFGW